MMDTLLLDTAAWDLVVGVDGNIAIASAPYSQAQDAASAIRTFVGEVYYNTTLGIPYWGSVLGKLPPASLVKSYFNAAALTVPGVVTAKTFLASLTDREIKGQVQIFDASGTVIAAAGF